LRLSRLSAYLSPPTKLQLFEDIVDVILDRRRSHAEGPGNLLIRQTLRYERDNVIFTTSQFKVTVASFSHDCTIQPALLSRQWRYISKKRTGQPLGADEIAANCLMEDIDHLLRRTFPRDVRYNPSFSTGYDFFIDFAMAKAMTLLSGMTSQIASRSTKLAIAKRPTVIRRLSGSRPGAKRRLSSAVVPVGFSVRWHNSKGRTMSHGLVENHRRSGDAMSSADEVLSLLETRRSVAMTLLTDPGPSKDQLRRMLTIAARVPDHGALQPWRFIVIDGEARKHASERLAPIFAAENEAMEPAQREKFTGVISRVLTQ
jgi:Nitroreductase family